MPRKPTEKVVEHRVTLGTYERQLLSDVAGSYQFNKVSSPVVALLSDNTAMLLILSLFGIYLDRILDPDWRNIIENMDDGQIADWLETQNLVGQGIGGLIGFLLSRGRTSGAVAGAVAGNTVVEGIEEIPTVLDEVLPPSFVTTFAISMVKLQNILLASNDIPNPFTNNNEVI